MLDPTASTPLYEQIAAQLEREIADGRYPAGEKIPSEHSLAQTFGVGRPTVRQATELLVRRQLIERRRGAGTFVKERGPELDLFSLGGTLESLGRSGERTTSRLLTRPRLVESELLATGRAVEIVRLTKISREPVLLEVVSFSETHFPGISALIVEGQSLSRLVKEHYGLRPRRARQAFAVQGVKPEWAAALQLSDDAQVLVVTRRISFSAVGEVVASIMVCRTDKFQFSQDMDLDD